MEDEDYFEFSDDLLVASTEKLQFRDTAIYINSSTDGQLDLVADTEIQIAATTIDINGAVALNGAITGATNITLSGELDAATLDISGDADIDGTLEADAITVNGTALSSVIAGTTVANATLAATVTVTDSTTNTNFPVVFHDESNALLDDTGALRYNPSTGELLVPKLTVAGTTTTVDTGTMKAETASISEGAAADAQPGAGRRRGECTWARAGGRRGGGVHRGRAVLRVARDERGRGRGAFLGTGLRY